MLLYGAFGYFQRDRDVAKSRLRFRHRECPLMADSVAKVAAVSGDNLCGARGIEVEGGLWPCSAVSR